MLSHMVNSDFCYYRKKFLIVDICILTKGEEQSRMTLKPFKDIGITHLFSCFIIMTDGKKCLHRFDTCCSSQCLSLDSAHLDTTMCYLLGMIVYV